MQSSLISTHAIARAPGSAFHAATDHPELESVNTFPVLATPEDDTVLGATIVLPDHPQIAPESKGSLLDGTEVEEALLLSDGLIGTRRVMEAKPDGYTLLLQVPSIVVTKHVPGLKGVDPLARLTPVTAVSISPAAIVASAKLPAKTLGEFISYCKTASTPCSLASGENLARVSARQLAAEAGIPNLIVTPHVAWAAHEARQRALDQVTENIAEYLRGGRLRRIV